MEATHHNLGVNAIPAIDCAEYGADRLAATINLIAGKFANLAEAFRLPTEWDVREAAANPATPEDVAPIVHYLASMRGGQSHEAEYVSRQAFLCSEMLEFHRWSVDCRRGVAYGALRIGMRDHGYGLVVGSPAADLVALAPVVLMTRFASFTRLHTILGFAYSPNSRPV
ncbi:MAG: hypothetical protein ACJ71Z_13235 [Aeromicrobium sp.]